MESTFEEKFKKLTEGMASLASEAQRLQSGRSQATFAWSKEQRIQLARKYEEMKKIKSKLRKIQEEAVQTSLRFQKVSRNLLKIPDSIVQTRKSRKLKIKGLLEEYTAKHQHINTADVQVKKNEQQSTANNECKKLQNLENEIDQVHDMKTQIISHIDTEETPEMENEVILSTDIEETPEIENEIILSNENEETPEMENEIILNNENEETPEMENEIILNNENEETPEMENEIILNNENDEIPEIENEIILSNEIDGEESNDGHEKIISGVPEIFENERNGEIVNQSVMTSKRSLPEDEKQEKIDLESSKKIKLESCNNNNSHPSFTGDLFFLASVASRIQETSSQKNLHESMLRDKNDADHKSFDEFHNEVNGNFSETSIDANLNKVEEEETNDSTSTTQEEVIGINGEINEVDQSSSTLVEEVDDVSQEIIEEKNESSSQMVIDFQQGQDDEGNDDCSDAETIDCSDAETIEDGDMSQEIVDQDMEHSIQITAEETTITEPNPKLIIQEEEEEGPSNSVDKVDQAVSSLVQNEDSNKSPEIDTENNIVIKENSVLNSNLKPEVSSNLKPDSEDKLVIDFPESSNDDESCNKSPTEEDDSSNLLYPGVSSVNNNNNTGKKKLPSNNEINHEEILEDYSDDSNSSSSSVSSSSSSDCGNMSEIKKDKRKRRSHRSLEAVIEKKLKKKPPQKQLENAMELIKRYMKQKKELLL